MKKTFATISFLFLSFLFITNLSFSQTFDGTWSCSYATTDDAANGTGQRTMSVVSFAENNFVALVSRASRNDYYLVGYVNADSTTGRISHIPYSASDLQTVWNNIFDNVPLNNPRDVARYFSNTSEDLFLVANNDADHNLLMFKLGTDSVYSVGKRLSTGSEDLWAIDVDHNGYVFVTTAGDSNTAAKVLVFGNTTDEAGWTSSDHAGTPLQTITLPDAGTARGIAVSSDGSLIFVSNYEAKKIYCYQGDVTNGYNLNPDFKFTMDSQFISSSDTFSVGPWGLQFLDGNNILFAASAADFHTGTGYEYSRVYAINPNDGVILDTLDIAQWNYKITGTFNNRTNNIASGYGSVYNLSFDDNNNMYTNCFYGWTIEKWTYSSTLPTIKLTEVKKETNNIPVDYRLSQNYPNPFNPTTTIEFSLPSGTDVVLNIYNLNGELIKTLLNRNLTAGKYSVRFDASGLASGTYIYELKAKNFRSAKKMILLK